jgi:BRCT domain type II-containing protein
MFAIADSEGRFSASSRLFDLNGETNSLKSKHSSATIVADVKRFPHQVKRTRFLVHTGGSSSRLRSKASSHKTAAVDHQN